MTAAAAVSAAIAFLWLGMVLAISFLEAPLKFRAPGVTIPLGLGIGRLVFRALNAVETVLAVVLVVAGLVAFGGEIGPVVAGAVVVVTLAIQLVAVRPALTRRSDAILAGGDHSERSNTHFVYVGFELIKVAALLAFGILALMS